MDNEHRSAAKQHLTIDSSYIEKHNPSDSFLQSEQAKLDSKDVVSSQEVSGRDPTMSTQELLSVQNENASIKSSAGYSPSRIPSSVFASKSATPLEWSLASNESLFSLHTGNNSFSREQTFMLYKSGELPYLDDMKNPPPSLVPIIAAQTLEKKIEDLNSCPVEPEKMEPELPANNNKAVPEENKKNVSQEKAAPADEPRNSIGSAHSFHFPVLEANAAGYGSSKVVMDKQPSEKQSKQEPRPQTPKTPPKPYWRSCFSCFSRCF